MIMVLKLFKFWFVVLFLCVGVYFGAYLQDPVTLKIPGVGAYTVTAAIALIGSFFLGVTLVTLYFGVDFIKKSIEVYRLNKGNRELLKQVSTLTELVAHAEGVPGTQGMKSSHAVRSTSGATSTSSPREATSVATSTW